MKEIVLILALICSHLTQAQEGVTLTVVVENVPNDNGKVVLGLYDGTTFMKAAPLQSATGETEERTVTLTIPNVNPGAYGVICFHDENDNSQMDFEANGMPKEAYGVSNNQMSYGPPQWENAKFEITDTDMEITIRM